ncbi:MAG: IclR family transcriptional regulator [Chloroflexi bacterium]|jgi:DNA-binding IclR family transcriptional regulator|nr:IclR family transcriptional regulator [Chloroflexota bacterium]
MARATGPAPRALTAARDAPARIRSVDRAADVLELLARERTASVTDVAAALGVHKSTASRLLAALEARDLVAQDGERGKYRLGFGIVRLAAAATARLDLVEQSRPVTRRLAETVGETVNVARLEAGAAVNLDQALGPAAITSHDWVGQRTPLHATSSGKVLLASLDRESRERLLAEPLPRFTPATITDPAVLRRQLDEAREVGWACTIEELEGGLNAVAAPIRGRDGVVVGAVSISGPSYRLTPERIPGISRDVLAAAAEIGARLGWYG